MNKLNGNISTRVLIKYILLQLPAVLILFVILIWLYFQGLMSLFVLIIIMCIWIIKDSILFFFVWQAYDIASIMPVADSGTAIEDINPDGYIQVRGELWRATLQENHNPIKKGQQVSIIGHKGLTLFVIEENKVEN